MHRGVPWLNVVVTHWAGHGDCNLCYGFYGPYFNPFVNVPAPESWPYIIASMAIHQFYFCLVCLGYRFGALSQIYPIQRGVVPMLVAIGGYWFVDETLNTQGMLSVCLISIAVMSLAFGRNWILQEGGQFQLRYLRES